LLRGLNGFPKVPLVTFFGLADQPPTVAANAVFALAYRYAESPGGRVQAPPDRILVPDAFEDEVVIKQPNGG
jgi:hypothetical protein